MGDQEKTVQLINQFIMMQYVKQIAESNPRKIVLSAPNGKISVPLILIDDPATWVPGNLGKYLN